MLNIINLTIDGKPIAQKRHRHTKTGITYDPSATEKKITKRALKSNITCDYKIPSKNNPIEVNFVFFFNPNKKESTKKFLEKIKNEDIPYTKKPDLDNLEKYLLDCMSNIIFIDDNQVFSCKSEKYFSINARTEIEIIIYEEV